MAHAVRTRRLGRNQGWRKATVVSLAQAVILSERVRTTRARAKEAQRVVERLITLGKQGSVAARRQARRVLKDPALVRRLFLEIAPRFKSRPGGCTRVLHDGVRTGDGASWAILELVELSEKRKITAPAAEEKKGARRRRSELEQEAAPASAEKQPKPEKEQTKRAQQQAPPPAEPKVSKPDKKGFLSGLRDFIKRRREK